MINPSPLTMVCLTLLMGGHIGWDGVPAIIKDEVEHFYPLLTGKPVPTGEEV